MVVGALVGALIFFEADLDGFVDSESIYINRLVFVGIFTGLFLFFLECLDVVNVIANILILLNAVSYLSLACLGIL